MNVLAPGPIRAVLFDAVGTLLLPREPVAATYCRFVRAYGSRLDESEVALRFAAALADDLREETSEEQEGLRWRQIVVQSLPDLDPRHVEPLFEQLWEYFGQSGSWLLSEEVPPVWQRLTEAGLTLGIASNFDSRLDGVLLGHPPLSRSPWCFVSSRIGFRKPSPKFFQAIEQQLGLSPGEIMLVGDDLRNDYEAARTAGWQAVLICAGAALAPRQVASLAELVV